MELNTKECCYDGKDCSICTTCENDQVVNIGNRICDPHLNNVMCCYDGGDCDEYIWETKHLPLSNEDNKFIGKFHNREKYFGDMVCVQCSCITFLRFRL